MRLREHGLEWLLELPLEEAEAADVLVYLDALESGRPYPTPRRLVSGAPWIALLDESDERRYVRVKNDRAIIRPTSRLICGWSIQGAARAPIEKLFAEETLAIPGQQTIAHLGADGALSFDNLFIADDVSLAILRDIDFGGCALEMLGRTWDEIYDGHPIYRVVDGVWRNVEITVFKDAGEWDYVDSIRMPDGRRDRADSDVVLEWQPTDPSPWQDAPRGKD